MILVDTHVHLHPCYDLETFLAAAAANFRAAAEQSWPGQPYQGVLCLTDAAEGAGFELLRGLAGAAGAGQGWSIGPTGERCSLLAEHPRQGRLFVLAGRQIRCREGIEVLALGTGRAFADGGGVEETIDQVSAEGAVAVLPWGFGKWTGRRGGVVRRILESRSPEEICLGDNSGRPAFWGEPAAFHAARHRGFRILPGSDPLPFAAEVGRAASYGCAVPGRLSETGPGHDLLAILADPATAVTPFGRRERLLPFLRNQVAMQWVKRRAGALPS